MSQQAPLEDTVPAAHRRSRLLRVAGVLAVALALNLLIIVLPRRWFVGWGRYGYIGVFLVTLLANASVFIPVPYPGMVAKLATELNPCGVALVAATGSALGETTAFFVGRAGQGTLADTAFYR